MIPRAIKIDTPLISPFGKPSLIIPIAKDTTAATNKMILMQSLKFSITSVHNVLILRGGKEFSPNTLLRSAMELTSIP